MPQTECFREFFWPYVCHGTKPNGDLGHVGLYFVWLAWLAVKACTAFEGETTGGSSRAATNGVSLSVRVAPRMAEFFLGVPCEVNTGSSNCLFMRIISESQTVNNLGKPDAGNPPVRFDSGVGVFGPVQRV
jgi:hypothetical protein